MNTYFREPANFWTHIIPAILGFPAMFFLLEKSTVTSSIVASIIYGFCFIVLFSMSALYHGIPKTDEGVAKWRKFDHASIYFMIAGTYTPTLLNLFEGWWLWGMMILQWSIVVVGVYSKVRGKLMHHRFSLALYLAMSWMIVVMINPLINKLPFDALLLLFGGGAFYTFGAWIYHLDKKRPNKGFHEIWHLMVIGGAVCHYFYTYWYIIY